ncbi:hypothetical protein CHS0354_014997 [Potamilus streckersoni]|uniref:Uncharacterized protein n=1 Tax=Potamilus streckersoni TaxID=2493646 RepID=A0AAE0SND7_9BIVA|nr:hypothetical protein CHS0354_014997 [Potamilus streckersoni]
MAEEMINTANEEPTCPIGIGRLKVPRTLTCLHTFCQHCLSSYIVTSSYTAGDKPCFNCHVCRRPTYHPVAGGMDPKEGASLFPKNIALLALLGEDKVRVDYLCAPCSSEEHSIIAMGFCVECKEYLCESCINFHKRLTAVKFHRVVAIDELLKTPDAIMNLNVSPSCAMHNDKEIEYFCTDHKTVCCVKCSIIDHRSCSEMVDLKTSAKSALDEDPQDIIEMLTRIEEFLMNHINITRLEAQTNEIVTTIKNAREQVNKLFDVIENEVKQKGRQLYKEEFMKLNDLNQQCQSQLTAVQCSRQLLDAILRLGNETQVFLTARQIKTQMINYREQIVKKYMSMESMEITLTLHDSLKTLMSLTADQLATLETKVSVGKFSLDRIFRTATLDSVIETKCPNSASEPLYRGSAWLPNGDDEVAVTIPKLKKIQFLTCIATVTPTRSFNTRYYCDGIAALSRDKMVISGHNNPGNENYYWSIVTSQGMEVYYHEIDQKGGSYTYLAINESKTLLYMSCYDTNAVYCFGLDGQLHFIYKSNNLFGPLGIGLDIDDNIYVAGNFSPNIHQLLPDGNLIQIIKTGIPKNPWKLTFNKSGNRFLLNNDSDMAHKCQIFVLKLF